MKTDWIAPCGVQVKEGQVWEEVDPRIATRRVVVRGFTSKPAILYNISKMQHERVEVPAVIIENCDMGGRRSVAKLERFTGKRTGYKLVTEAL